MKPQIIVVIPARLGSTRLPRKVLLAETGRTLVQHVYDNAAGAKSATRVVVATDSREVADACASFGAEAVMTSPDHVNGTSRIAEAADTLGVRDGDIVVNVQGDEPELEPHVLDAAVDAMLRDDRCVMSTPCAPFGADERIDDPAAVKVVFARDGAALYFSRSVIPHDRDGDAPPEARPLRHIGLYCYRRPFLREYLRLTPTPLEQAEKLEQLRVLEHGHRIAMAVCRTDSRGGIDTREQYEAFVKRWKSRR